MEMVFVHPIAITTMKSILAAAALLTAIHVKAQTCDCEKEFLYIKHTIEQNFSGFADKIKTITRASYDKNVDDLLKLTHNKFASDNCLLIINRYLSIFKSHHLGFYGSSDPYKTDTDFVNHRPVFTVTDKEMQRSKNTASWEGIYNFTYDSSTKIVVVKDPTPLHDYVGVTVESTRPTWKKGMVKFEGKLVNDSLLEGLLYMRNHRPKLEYFYLHDDHTMISGDWRREGAPIKKIAGPSSSTGQFRTIDAKLLVPGTLYIKIGSFGLDYKPRIDSVLKANEAILNATANLVLDLRDNGGGSDDSWEGLIPYFYSGPIKMIGADLLATETTISAYKKMLGNKNLSKENMAHINNKIERMEKAKGQWIVSNEDETDSSFVPKPFPKKIVILMDRWCGSSTEEFLLAARQSTKVILAGENTIGNLDYSNIVEAPFSCYPYMLVYPTTRSRRLDIHQGIDNTGIAPQYHFSGSSDWINEALKILGQ